MNRSMILVGIGIGAGLMYALDPQQGNRRRALARDKLTRAAHVTGRAVGATSRDVAHRATGLAASLHSRFFDQDAPDEVVEARVRARLGRISSHPGAVDVDVRDGVVVLRGPMLKSEMNEVISRLASVRGVKRVENRLEPHEAGEHVPALQGRPVRAVQAVRDWSPTVRLFVGLAGAILAAVGATRRDKAGMLVGGVGLALVARAATHISFEQLAALVERARQEDTAKGVPIPVKIGPRPDHPFGPGPISDRIH